MKISIITPSYNQGAYLRETIESVINQNYANLEFILIDGGSKDESILIIEKYKKHFSYWISEKDKGQSNAINKGLKRATGDIITWINSDDLLLPGALQQVADQFALLPQTTGVLHGGTVLFENNKDLREVYNYGIPSIEKYLSGMAFSQPAAFFRRSFLEQVGLLREDLHFGMDYDLFARLATVCHFQPTQTLFSKYRLHNESKSVAHSEKFRRDWNRVFLSICQHIGWDHIKDEVSFFVPELEGRNELLKYSYSINNEILKKADQHKVVFYFLSDLLLHYYWYDQRDTARLLLAKMESRFPKKWFKEEQRLADVVKKLKIPEIFLVYLKCINKYLRSKH